MRRKSGSMKPAGLHTATEQSRIRQRTGGIVHRDIFHIPGKRLQCVQNGFRPGGAANGNTDLIPGKILIQDFPEFLPEYENLDELKAHYKRGGLGDMKVKRFLNNVLQAELEPIRNRRKEWQKDIPAVYEILRKGSEKAEKVAAETLKDVKAAMKINYFDDEELIKMQSVKYTEE